MMKAESSNGACKRAHSNNCSALGVWPVSAPPPLAQLSTCAMAEDPAKKIKISSFKVSVNTCSDVDAARLRFSLFARFYSLRLFYILGWLLVILVRNLHILWVGWRLQGRLLISFDGVPSSSSLPGNEAYTLTTQTHFPKKVALPSLAEVGLACVTIC